MRRPFETVFFLTSCGKRSNFFIQDLERVVQLETLNFVTLWKEKRKHLKSNAQTVWRFLMIDFGMIFTFDQ